MVVFLIIPLWLVASWVFMLPPVCFKQTSAHNACINNLRQIDGAKDQWAIENGWAPV